MTRAVAVRSLLALVASAALVACGAPPSTAVDPIVHGTPESAATWVVMVVQQAAGSTRVRLCSGAVIAPRAVLTAKHCVYRSVAGSTTWEAVPRGELSVRMGTSFRASERTVAVTEVRTTEGPYRDDDGRTGGDLAVLVLGEALDVTPKDIGRTPVAEGEPVRIVGFGYTQPGGTDPADLGTLHRGEATVQRVEANVFSTTGAQWTCTGDSGGPALHVGRDELVGVTSIGPTGCRVSTSYYTRIDRYLSLFDGIVEVASTRDAGAVPDAPTDARSDAAAARTMAPVEGACAVRHHGGRPSMGALPALAALALRRRRARSTTREHVRARALPRR